MDIIYWKDADGRVVAYTPPGGMTTEEARASSNVPQDTPTFVIDHELLPKAHMAAWRMDDEGVLSVDQPTVDALDVPREASSGDFKNALLDLGWYADVDAAVAIARGRAAIMWASASVYRRDSPLVAQIAAAIGKTEADIDTLFKKTRDYA